MKRTRKGFYFITKPVAWCIIHRNREKVNRIWNSIHWATAGALTESTGTHPESGSHKNTAPHRCETAPWNPIRESLPDTDGDFLARLCPSLIKICSWLNAAGFAYDGHGIGMAQILLMLAAAIDDQCHLWALAQRFKFAGSDGRDEKEIFEVIGKSISDQRAIRLVLSLGAQHAERLLAHL